MQVFSKILRTLWNLWELRALVLLSLSLQIILIIFSNRRKYSKGNLIRAIIWLAYLSADWVATVSLGVLSNGQGDNSQDDQSYVIMAFWAPFLLLHLGGPDTITAYALEDNELWLRHLLGLIVQVGVAFYVFVRSLKPSQLNFAAIPIFVAGCIKYGERTWVLWSASSQNFRESLLPRPDPGPNYAKFMEEYILKKSEGFVLSWDATQVSHDEANNSAATRERLSDVVILNAAYDFFLIFRRLFADLILSFQDLEKSLLFFRDIYWEDAFKVIEVELGFMYDVLYTKAPTIYSLWGVARRFTCILSTTTALLAFCIIDWHKYLLVDAIVTFFLLVGAIGLEIYAILLLLSSDWTSRWLSNHWSGKPNNWLRFITSKKKWSNSMAQYNLSCSCLKSEPTICCKILKLACIHRTIETYLSGNSEDVPQYLKESIFKQLAGRSRRAPQFGVRKELCALRADQVLQQENCKHELGWSFDFEFDHSILLWHLATDLCYFCDIESDGKDPRISSKLLSDYMMYILVKRPYMLPNGIGQIRFQDTCAEAMEFFQENKITIFNEDACQKLLKVEIIIPPSEIKGDRSKSVLFDACKLAKCLRSMEREKQWGKQQKWEIINQVWVEILSYAANQCRWNHHAQQLRRGGELLTHVWLLMAHLGISEHYQISQGHARTKLVVL
ncbi:unnamed protein product [Ilex paraguariensis]|uniref:DUF4220 domain-containing protein n=1 Tax=Ilex paraguariensis TaxID=185542 RepID=A0ABC8SWF9_9AQUA